MINSKLVITLQIIKNLRRKEMNFKHVSLINALIISLVVSTVLWADPAIVVEPNAIEDDLNTGDIEDHVVNVSNEGDEILRFTIDLEIIDEPDIVRANNHPPIRGPQRDDLGDEIAEFNVVQDSMSGLAWNGELMWGVGEGRMVAFDPVEEEIVEDVNLRDQYTGMAYDGQDFWVGLSGVRDQAGLCQIDREGNVLENIQVQGNSVFGVAYDGENLWYSSFDFNNRQGIVRQITVNGEQLREIDCRNILEGFALSLEWIPEHEDGHLWIVSWENRILYQLNVVGDEPEIVQQSQINRSDRYGLAHDGENLWYSVGGTWYVIDDGIEELRWLSYDPDEGEIEPDEDTDVFVTLDATGLIEGNYEADIHFLSNDPDNEDVAVNVTMSVTGVPVIEVTWSEDYGYPDEIDWNMAFPDLFTGESYELPVTVRNVGTAELEVDEISCENEIFMADPNNFALDPGEEQVVTFSFNPDEDGNHDADMIIVWNSPDEEDFIISMIGEATGPPAIVVEPNAIEDDLNTGDVAEHVINIANEGDALLRFTIEHEILEEPERDDGVRRNGPLRDDLGDEIAQFNVGQVPWSGLAWDGELMWGVGGDLMVAFDPEAEEIVEDVNLNVQYMGMAYDGRDFWVGRFGGDNRNPVLQQIDREGNVLENIQVQGMIVFGVAFDGENLWYYSADFQEENMIIRQITVEGEPIRQIDCRNILQGFGFSLEWIPEHDDGHLWTVSFQEQTLYQLNVAGDEPEIVQETQINLGDQYGLGHDGENLWYSTERTWYVIDDGIREHRWLSYEPDEGEIEPDDDIDVFVTLDAAGLIEGDYEADIHFLSNDPDNADVVVNVTIFVTGVPVIEVTWSEEYGYPDEIDWNMAFPDLFTGESYQVPITVHNVGTAELTVDEISCENEIFTADPGNFDLAPDEEQVVTFTFNPDEDGDHNADMIIVWNSPDEEDFLIPMTGETSAPPAIVVQPNAIEDDLNTGDVAEHVINIANEGDADLRFTIEHEIVEEPDIVRANNHSPLRGPQRDELGDEIAQFNFDRAAWTGLAWDGQLMWGIDAGQRQMVAFDPDEEEIVERVNMNGQYIGMTYDGQAFWAGQLGEEEPVSRIMQIDRNGNVIEILNVQGWMIHSVSYDGENLWYFSLNINDENTIIRQITLEGEQLREINCSNIIQDLRLAITWVAEHDDGHLWTIAYNARNLYQLDISEDEPEIVQETQINRGEDVYGLEHDGENMWYSNIDGNWYVIDDGIQEVRWLTYEPDEGELEPGADIDVLVTLDAEGLIEGNYEADIHVLSNDPENQDVVISVTMSITGAPVIEVTWPEEYGYPDEINWNTAFEDIFTGESYQIPVMVRNVGTADLIVEEITCDDDVFSVNPDNFAITPREEREVNIIFNAEEDGNYEAEMCIVWNSPNEEDCIIRMVAESTGPPVIDVVPNAIEDDLDIGDVVEHVINVSNDGDAVLRFTIEHDIINEPDIVRANYYSPIRGPQRDELGEVIDEYNFGEVIWTGLAWDGSLMWGIDINRQQIVAFNPEEEEIVERVNLNGQCIGIAYDGQAFWVGQMNDEDRSGRLLQIDPNGNVLEAIEIQGGWIYGVAYDGENLWYYSMDMDVDNVFIRQITVQGEQLRQINCSNIIQELGFSIAWVNEHDDGHLWVAASETRTLYQLDVSENEPEIVQQTQLNESDFYGIEHDGENMWYSTVNGNWYVIDDGIREVRWLNYDPDEGEIVSGADLDVIVTLDATDLVEGNYEADVHFLSNDPANQDLTVSVTMHVESLEIENEAVTPDEYRLYSAYPNPFNATTRLMYDVPQASRVSIRVYDTAGHLVSTLLNGEQTAGSHVAVWNSENTAAGVYLVRMESTNFRAVHRIVLVK